MEQRQICKSQVSFHCVYCKPIEKFLKMYQTDSPMIPFLEKDLEDLLRIMMDRFVKQSIMEKQHRHKNCAVLLLQTMTDTKHIRTLIQALWQIWK